MYTPEQLQQILPKLLLRGEGETIEFKLNYPEPKMIGERISGLANSAKLIGEQVGFLIYGVDDKTKEIVGTTFDVYEQRVGNEPLVNWLIQRLNPKINVIIDAITYEGERVVIFQIPSAVNQPTKFENIANIRLGSTTRKLSDFPDKERCIWTNADGRSFENEVALLDLTSTKVLELLDYDSYFRLSQYPLPSKTEQFIEKMAEDKIVRKNLNNWDITNLGAILLAQDIEAFPTLKRKMVRVIEYEGNDRVKRLKETDGKKGYASGWERLVSFLLSRLPHNEEIKKALRVEEKMFPEIAIREIIANALIHQDFFISGSGPMIEIFNDRIEITNPGKPLIDTQRFIDHIPRSRNEQLADHMRRMRICEESGSGIDRALSSIELYQLPAPRFDAGDDYTRVSIYAHKALNKMSREDKVRACYQHSVLRFITKNYMNNNSLRERFNIPEHNYATASRIITDTVEAGLIKPTVLSKKHAKYIPYWA